MNIVLCDTQFIFREGIKSILKELNNYKVVAEFEDINDLRPFLSKNKVDIIIGDFTSDIAIQELEQIENFFPKTNILIIANEINQNRLFNILEIKSVKGYYLKDSKKVDIILAITVIANNEKTFCHQIIDFLQRAIVPKNTVDKKSIQILKRLTAREADIVKLVAEGKTAKEIAQKLFISIHTVNTYRKNILKKLDVKNSSELVLYALKNNIIDSTEYYI